MECTPSPLNSEVSRMLQTPTNLIHPLVRHDIVVKDAQDLDQLLDRAVQRIIPAALERRQGILVTQLFPNRYAIEVDEEVPCGVIQEKRIHPEGA